MSARTAGRSPTSVFEAGIARFGRKEKTKNTCFPTQRHHHLIFHSSDSPLYVSKRFWGSPSDEKRKKCNATMKQSINSTRVPTLQQSFVLNNRRGDRRSTVPPGLSFLGGTQSGTDRISKQEVVAIIESALLLTSSFHFLEDDEDDVGDKSPFHNQ